MGNKEQKTCKKPLNFLNYIQGKTEPLFRHFILSKKRGEY